MSIASERTAADRRARSACAGCSRRRASIPTTRSCGNAVTPGSPTGRPVRSPSSSSTSSSRSSWSQNATNIVAQKYFRGTPGHARAGVVAAPGRRPHRRHDHPLGDRGRLLRRPGRSRRVQRRAEVHPGHPAGRVQQPGLVQHRRRRACRNRRARASSSPSTTTMNSILNWYREEGIIFKGGSGAGVNLSRIRSSKEPMHGRRHGVRAR